MSANQSPARRDFLRTAAGAATFFVLPSHMLFGQDTPSEQFRFAKVGCGGMGGGDLNATIGAGGKLVAMCDVDDDRASGAYNKHPTIPRYKDYRAMLDRHQHEIDGVVVSTPDHTHACIALDAIQRGKHVYVQKPLARTYDECQVLLDAAKAHKVVTQMGNQGHAGSGLKRWKQMQDEGAFGDILEVNTWSNRPVWPQGMTELAKGEKHPNTLHWDLWLGPAAKRDYAKAYLPFAWRGWWDFGAGAMGDMACHNMDPVFWIFELGAPDKIKATVSEAATVAYPKWSIVEFTFNKSPVTGKPIKMTWFDGPKRPEIPAGSHEELETGDNGCMIVGSELSAMGASHASPPRVISLTGQEYGAHVKDAEKHWREKGKPLQGTNHYGQWIEACKANDPEMPGSKFDYSVPFTQAILLGCLATRFPDVELEWDHEKNQFSNHDEANQWLAFEAREGFSVTL